MPAPPFQATLFFESNVLAGWSEVYWLDSADYGQAATDLDLIAGARMALSTSATAIIATRISDPLIFRDRVTAGAAALLPGTWTTGGTSVLPIWTALLLTQQGSPFRFSNRYLRGLPSAISNASGQYNRLAAYETALAAYFAVLVSKTVLIVRKPKPPVGGSYPSVPITSLVSQRFVEHKVGRPFGLPVGRRLPR